MKCSKCGAELSDDTKFCSYCGQKIEKSTTPPPIVEETEIPPIPNKEPVIENSKKSDDPKSLAEKIKDKASEKWSKLSTYGKITTVALVFFILFCLVAFLFGKTSAGIIAVLQIMLTVVAILMKRQIIKTPKNWLHIIALALAIVLLVPYISLFKVDYGDAEKFKWSDILLADAVPEPNSLFGEIISNHDDYLSLYVYKTSIEDYNGYVEACKEKGFAVEADQSEQSYYAYDAGGYKLSLYYDESDSKMHIGIEAAEEYGTLVWSDSEIASMLPVPTSTAGEITQDDETGFQAYVSNTSIDEFKTYATACADMGFNIDSYDSDKFYSAENSEGYKLSVSYQGNNVMSVSVDEPEYDVSIEIECVENLLFSKYDVDVYIDDMFEGTIKHGTTEIFELIKNKGSYDIKFVNAEDDSVDAVTQFEVVQDSSIKYKISCSSSQIDVTNLNQQDVVESTDTSSEKEETIVTEKTENNQTSGKIVMQNSAVDYIGSEWTIETITDHFKSLGFTNIRAVPCEPDDNNYRKNIFELVIKKGWATTDPWEAGEEFDSDAEISVYYNEYPVLTVENCPDLVTILTSKDLGYLTFCERYDGRYVEFDAYVIGHLTYDGGTSHIIDVTGGDYDGQSEIDAYNPDTYAGEIIRIGDRTWGNNIDKSVSEGDLVTVSGEIDASWAEYYKSVYVETRELSKR